MALLQLKIDRHLVSPARNQPGGRGIHLQNTPRGRQNTLVHHHIARGFYDLEIRNPPVRLDLDAQAGDKMGRPGNAGRLIPHAEKPVVDVLMERSEKAVAASPGRATRRARG